jgi:hypothetical protein
MTFRRLLVGMTVVSAFSVWSWCRGDSSHACCPSVEPVCVTADTHDDGVGTHDDSEYRYRTNQARHWRHVMVGNHR